MTVCDMHMYLFIALFILMVIMYNSKLIINYFSILLIGEQLRVALIQLQLFLDW